MSAPFFNQPPASPPPATWRVLVWAAFTGWLFNAWVLGYYHWASVLSFEVPSHAAVASGHLWTLFTYVLTGEGTVHLTQWTMGLAGIVFLFVVARAVEPLLPRWSLLWLCAACALGGSVAWLPWHWADGSSLVSGTSVLVLGLLSFWCLAVPDDVASVQFFGVSAVRPVVFFWIALALETGSFLGFELPQALGHPGIFKGNFYDSAHVGGMLAGWAFAHFVRRPAPEDSPVLPDEVVMLKPATVTVGARRATPPATANSSQPPFATTRELRAEVDRILDKINDGGLHSLSPQERQTLDQAKRLLKK